MVSSVLSVIVGITAGIAETAFILNPPSNKPLLWFAAWKTFSGAGAVMLNSEDSTSAHSGYLGLATAFSVYTYSQNALVVGAIVLSDFVITTGLHYLLRSSLWDTMSQEPDSHISTYEETSDSLVPEANLGETYDN